MLHLEIQFNFTAEDGVYCAVIQLVTSQLYKDTTQCKNIKKQSNW